MGGGFAYKISVVADGDSSLACYVVDFSTLRGMGTSVKCWFVFGNS